MATMLWLNRRFTSGGVRLLAEEKTGASNEKGTIVEIDSEALVNHLFRYSRSGHETLGPHRSDYQFSVHG